MSLIQSPKTASEKEKSVPSDPLGDTRNLEHKNLELLRYYLGKDIKKLDQKIQVSDSNMVGYFLASLIDILIVILFGDSFNTLINYIYSKLFRTSESVCELFIFASKLICITLLIVIFFAVIKITKVIKEKHDKKLRESGKAQFTIDDDKQELIDQFDNIACDGLLICDSYIQKHKEADQKWVRDFYLYEIIHHLSKAAMIFDKIYQNRGAYVSSKNAELLDTYRVNNFIEFFNAIVAFIQMSVPSASGNNDLDKDIVNLAEYTKKWKSM